MQSIQTHPKYKHLEASLLDAINHFNTRGTTVTKGDRNIIKSVVIEGDILNIKSFKTPGPLNSLVYKYVRPSKAKRSFEYALKLTECNILTPFPIAYIEQTSASGLKESYYISKHVNYDFDFRELIHNPQFPDRDLILRLFTQFTYQLHENNINFLDHSPGNTLVVKRENGYDFYLIDLNRMRFETMTFTKRMHNFRRLWLSKTMVKIMADEYAKLYNKSYTETHELMLKHSRAFQLKVDSKKLRRSGRKIKFKS